MLSKEESKRYQKQIMLDNVGINGQIKIKQAKVAVVGAGGLGCPVLQYLTSVGVGTIGIIDFDTVEASNLHRQVLYSENDIGSFKVEVAMKKLSVQNPFIKIIAHQTLLNEENAESVLSDYDIVVDGSDNFLTRYIVNDICLKLNKPLVYGSILGYEGQLAIFNYKGSKNLRDIFPEPPLAEDVPSCSENGVMGYVPGIVGMLMCNLTIQILLDEVISLNQFYIMDINTLNIKTLKF
jgi:molybdopterin/thiamine biosynthesis adenylyltransferase